MLVSIRARMARTGVDEVLDEILTICEINRIKLVRMIEDRKQRTEDGRPNGVGVEVKNGK